jgi:hypothetical protein
LNNIAIITNRVLIQLVNGSRHYPIVAIYIAYVFSCCDFSTFIPGIAQSTIIFID